MNKQIGIGLILISLVGCAIPEVKQPDVSLKKETLTNQDEILVGTTATMNFGVGKQRESNFQSCLPPSPDAIDTDQSSESLGLSLPTEGGNESMSGGRSGVEMAGRTPGVLLAREILFRVCEFIMNNDVPIEQATAMYDQAFGVLQAVMMSETENTSIAISETENSSQTTSTALPTATDSLSGEMTDPIQSMGDDVQDSLTDSAQDAGTEFVEDTTADVEDAAQETFQ